MRSVLGIALDDTLAAIVNRIATLRSRQDSDADDLRHALYDLDAFAYEFSGDD